MTTEHTPDPAEVAPPAPPIATVRKALLGAAFGFAGALGTALLDGALAGTELLAAAGVGLVTGAGVWRIPNAIERRALAAAGLQVSPPPRRPVSRQQRRRRARRRRA